MTYVARPGAKTTEAARAPAGALNVPRRVESRCASRGAHTCTCLRFDSPDVRVSLSVEYPVPPRSLAAQEAAARFDDVQHDSTHYQEPRTGRGNVGLASWLTLQRHLSLWPRAVAPSRMFPEKTSCTTTQTVARSLCVSCVLPPFHSCCVLFAQFSKSHTNSDAARSARCLQLMKQRLPRGRLTTPRDG